MLYTACVQVNSGEIFVHQLGLVRDPVWAWMRWCCPSFTDMSANAVFSDIFQINKFGELTFDLKSLFLIQHTNHSICSQCNQQIYRCGHPVYYHQHIHQNHFESSVSEAMLPNINRLFCVHCQNHSGSVALLRHFVSLPTVLMIELSSDCITQMFFPHKMETLGVSYCLKGMVRCVSRYFTVALKSERGWIYFDDLCVSVICFSSLQELLYNYSDGCFFLPFIYCKIISPVCQTFTHSREKTILPCWYLPQGTTSILDVIFG